MNHTRGLSLGETKRSRKAVLVAMIFAILALAAPASAAPSLDVDTISSGGSHSPYMTTLGRSWS